VELQPGGVRLQRFAASDHATVEQPG